MPIAPEWTFVQVRRSAIAVARELERRAPERITTAWWKEERGAKIFVDRKSHLFLDGTVLDYDTALLTKGFVFHNPNAKQTCGCGSSFGA